MRDGTPRVGRLFAHAVYTTGYTVDGAPEPVIFEITEVTDGKVFYGPAQAGITTTANRWIHRRTFATDVLGEWVGDRDSTRGATGVLSDMVWAVGGCWEDGRGACGAHGAPLPCPFPRAHDIVYRPADAPERPSSETDPAAAELLLEIVKFTAPCELNEDKDCVEHDRRSPCGFADLHSFVAALPGGPETLAAASQARIEAAPPPKRNEAREILAEIFARIGKCRERRGACDTHGHDWPCVYTRAQDYLASTT